jgi:hypothetical protein
MYSGVFMTGPYPCWIMTAGYGAPLANLDKIKGLDVNGVVIDEPLNLAGKRVIRVHPCSVDGRIQAFTELHNIHIPHGFVYINSKVSLHIIIFWFKCIDMSFDSLGTSPSLPTSMAIQL